MSDLITLTARVEHAANTLRAYAGGDAAQALTAWLDAASELYRQRLVHVEPAGLLALQAQVRQLETLKQLASGALQTNGCL